MSFDQPNSGDNPDQPRHEQPGDNPPGTGQSSADQGAGQSADQPQTPYGQQQSPYGQQQSPYGQHDPYGQPGAPGQQGSPGQQGAFGQEGGYGQPSASQFSASQPSASQPSASQPSASQPSANYQGSGDQQPYGQQSAADQSGGWGGGQGDWGQSQNQQPAQQPQQPQAGQNPWDTGAPTQNPWDQNQATAGAPAGYGPPQQGSAVNQIKEANPLKAMFDFSFNTFATPGLVRLIYILAMVLAALYWIGLIISGFASGAVSAGFGGDFNPAFGILAIIFGWIPAFFWILLVRVGLEFALATVRTSEDIRHIRANAND